MVLKVILLKRKNQLGYQRKRGDNVFNLITGVILYFYLSIGAIIGLKVANLKENNKWYRKVLMTLFFASFWLPWIFAEILSANIKGGE